MAAVQSSIAEFTSHQAQTLNELSPKIFKRYQVSECFTPRSSGVLTWLSW